MILTGETFAYILSLGLTPEQGKGLIDRLRADALAFSRPADLNGRNEEIEHIRNVSTYAERKRAKDRERQRLIREERRVAKEIAEQSRDVAGESREVAKDRAIPAINRAISGEQPAIPRACVRDNNLPTEIYNQTIPDFADASWPETSPPSKADLDRLQAALLDAGGDALASLAVAPKLAVLAPILRLAQRGKGPPCDLNADVLPVIRARSARAPPGSIKSWDFFTEAITEARDRRLSGAPALQVVKTHERPSPQSAKFEARQQNYADAIAGAASAARSRAIDRAGGF